MGGRGRDVITVKVVDHPAHSRDLAPSDFHFVFAFKISGRQEVSQRQRDEKRSHCLVTCAGGEVL